MKWFLMLASVSVASACASENTTTNRSIGLANPAAQYCEKIGGKVEIRNGPGGQAGYCHLPDGRVIDEWELYRSQQS